MTPQGKNDKDEKDDKAVWQHKTKMYDTSGPNQEIPMGHKRTKIRKHRNIPTRNLLRKKKTKNNKK